MSKPTRLPRITLPTSLLVSKYDHAIDNEWNADNWLSLGNVNAFVGGVKEELGRTIGNANLTQAGSEQRSQGNAEYNAAKAERVIEGAKDKFAGKVQSGVSAALGDEQARDQARAKATAGEETMQQNKLG